MNPAPDSLFLAVDGQRARNVTWESYVHDLDRLWIRISYVRDDFVKHYFAPGTMDSPVSSRRHCLRRRRKHRLVTYWQCGFVVASLTGDDCDQPLAEVSTAVYGDRGP